MLYTISFLTVIIVSLDRLLTLLLGARYRQRASSKRTCLTVIAVLWILSIVGAFPYFWNPLVTWFCGRIITPICLVTSIFSYTKTFFALRHSQIHAAQNHVSQGQPRQESTPNLSRYKAAVSSALWVQIPAAKRWLFATCP